MPWEASRIGKKTRAEKAMRKKLAKKSTRAEAAKRDKEGAGEKARRRLGNVATGISYGAGMVEDEIAAPFESMERKHHRAVDVLNQNKESYDQMSRWERFKWSAKNPFARMSASHKKGDTEKRMAREGELKQLVTPSSGSQESSGGNRDKYQDTLNNYTLKEDGLGDYVQMGMKMAGSAAPVAGSVLQYGTKIVGGLNDVVGKDVPLKDVMGGELQSQQDLAALGGGIGGIATGALGTIGAINSGINSGRAISKGREEGNSEKVGNGALDMASSGLAFAKGGVNIGKNVAEFAGATSPGFVGGMVPGVNMLIGGVQFIKGSSNLTRFGSRMHNLGSSLEGMEKAGLSEHSKNPNVRRIHRTAEQLREQSKIDMTGAGFDTASGMLKMASGAAALSGVGSAAAPVLTGAAVASDFAKGKVMGHQGKSMRQGILNEEFDLRDKMVELQWAHPEMNLSDREAKHIVLQQQGFTTGKRREAFQHVTMDRSEKLVEGANAGYSTEKRLMSDIGLEKMKDGYSLQAVTERMGMEKGKDWKRQMMEEKNSRMANPFQYTNDKKARKKAAEEEAERKESMEKAKKEAIKRAQAESKRRKELAPAPEMDLAEKNNDMIQDLLGEHATLSGKGKFDEGEKIMKQIRVLMGRA